MKRLLVIVVFAISNSAYAEDLWLEGRLDCGLWAKARKEDSARALEHLLTGTINGLAIGAEINLWQTSKGSVNPDQLYLWMDGWCLKNPLKRVISGAIDFADEQTNGAYSKRYLPQ